MDRTMGDVQRALGEQHGELWGLIAGLDDEGWQRASRCEGWDVADVVLHMAQTEEMALASLDGRLGGDESAGFVKAVAVLGPTATVDDTAAWAVEHERGAPSAEVAQRWRAVSDQLLARLADDDSHRRVLWVSGELSAATLAATRLAECWIHTGDVAEALAVELEPGDRLRHVARLAWRTLPYAFARAGRELGGPVAFRLHGPTGEPWDLEPDGEAATVVEGSGVELCLVAARRVEPADTGLHATGPDARAVLDLVRTYA
ncbi:MAG TPA: maleylpyruvate isomerase family mycothiol-dependent enzyme [Acidimicrobiales bacterium]|nr:maleylpyruvate isomerase family mycothiol-dependent enzyme [Acidimicrobiales bacterium]